MQLFTREWGAGGRHAVLIHGVFSSSRNWRRVGPALADRGYHVVAVDLPGHGQSPRADRYTAGLLAQSVLESVPADPDLAIGHSLGGLTLSFIAERLQPARAVYTDPAFTSPELTWWQKKGAGFAAKRILRQSAEKIAAQNPRWDLEDAQIESEDFRLFDQKMLRLLGAPGLLRTPVSAPVPSLAVLADPSAFVPPECADALRGIGYEVRTVPGASHTINRDDFEGYMAALDGWL